MLKPLELRANRAASEHVNSDGVSMSDFDPELLARDFPCVGHPGIQYNRIYWPIELESLCEWSAALDPFTKIFLGSVARRVERSLNLPAQGIRLTVIEMEYDRGPYPCVACIPTRETVGDIA
jgi:hypothetical protein